jgi:hypothetical protein
VGRESAGGRMVVDEVVEDTDADKAADAVVVAGVSLSVDAEDAW